ncbi:hypothetical protein CPC08DRAFT_820681 [Agrocybe pediades]|nr:hypothetical protein CPC08DRAFT_820681 [Agrocybe pediades]
MSSPAEALPLIPVDVSKLTGPPLLGFFINWFLFGTLTTQVYMYFLAFPNDPATIRLLVLGVFVLESAQSFLFIQSAFHSFASGFGNIGVFNEVNTLWLSAPVMSGIVAFVAQVFYAHRLRIIAQSKILPALIVFLAFAQMGGAIANGVVCKKAALFNKILGMQAYVTTGIWNGASAVCDILIAIFMTIHLNRRSDTGMKHTALIVKKIIRLTIETGSLTAVISIINIVLAVLPSQPNYYMTPTGVLGKLYSNSMLALLNNRMKIGNESHILSASGNNIPFSGKTDLPSLNTPNSRFENMKAHIGRGPGQMDDYELTEAGSGTHTEERVDFPSPGGSWTVKDGQSTEEVIEVSKPTSWV